MRFICIALLGFFFCTCSSSIQQNDATISFSKQEHNFGSLKYKNPGDCIFEFKNPGKSALVIYNVKTSCGCTVPEWTKKPINPGSKGEIKIKYDSDFPGVFHKTITVYFNGENSPVTLKIKGKVQYPNDIMENEK